jgi:hypothetical protein
MAQLTDATGEKSAFTSRRRAVSVGADWLARMAELADATDSKSVAL